MNIKTPQQFAAFLAFILASISTLSYTIIVVILSNPFSFIVAALLFILIGTIGYFIIFKLLKDLIFARIKVLYRTIHSFKINKGDFPINMNEDVLGKTEKEVYTWAKSKKEEIEVLQKQEAFRREFIGNLAHELRTPVFSIQGYILTLLEGGLEDENINRRFLERAAKGVDRMTQILEDLNTITRIESEQLDIELKRVNIKELVHEILESFEIKAKKKSIKLLIEQKNADPLYVNCDKNKINQVLTNLINNAINYGKENGTVIVRYFDYESNILLEVADNGLGIEEKHLTRLFERFYRVDKSRARNEGGSGLGLAICKHFIEAHGQMIDVRSTIGKGSTFSFTLEKG